MFKHLLISLFCFLTCTANAQSDTFRIAVAGHTYGAHAGTNIGLYPEFLSTFNDHKNRYDYLVLTGDIVRNSTTNSWNTVAGELDAMGLPYYYVRGNHEKGSIATNVFTNKHGGNYYAFKEGNLLNVVLNSGQYSAQVSNEEITFLSNTLAAYQDSVDYIFVYFHFLLWNGDPKYIDIKSNLGSQHNYLKNTANYWADIHPVLNNYPNKAIHVIAGDLGGRSYSIPAYYENLGHIKLTASGMGEVPDENYLAYTFVNQQLVSTKVIPLDTTLPTRDISYYEYFATNLAELNENDDLLRVHGNTLMWLGNRDIELAVYQLNGQHVHTLRLEPQKELVLPVQETGIYLLCGIANNRLITKKVYSGAH